MKALHKLLAVTLLVALVGFGLTVFAYFVVWDPDDPPVIGFTDKECRNPDWKIFINHNALIAADGKKDPDSENPDKIWKYYSYIEWGDYTYTCHRLRYGEVRVIGVVPKKPINGGTGTIKPPPPPNPQEPRPDPEEEEELTEADVLTEEEFQELKDCWEQKAEALSDLEGWSDDDTSSATWGVERGEKGAFGHTDATATRKTNSEGEEETSIAINVSIFTDDIAGNGQFKFNHLLTYTQMHEKIHVFQILNEFNDGDRQLVPEPYEWYWLEVQTHNRVNEWWPKLFPFKNKKVSGLTPLHCPR